ncbi:hypothetical protein Goari_015853, partial [Gossypium aridum]|nr:hypothetical protein [Gossypium aridum]
DCKGSSTTLQTRCFQQPPFFLDGFPKANFISLHKSPFQISHQIITTSTMQSAAFSLPSPSSHPYLKPRHFASNPTFYPIRGVSKGRDFSDSTNAISIPSFPKRSWSLSSSSPLPLRAWTSAPSLSKPSPLQLRATAAENAGEAGKSGSLLKTLELGLLFGLWYIFNIYFNIYNK